MTRNSFFDSVQLWTEQVLTKRKAKKLHKKQNKTVKSEALDWVHAVVFAVVVVILINQYLFQLFVIPSPSMLETLQIGDRVSVSKVTYGIELWPEGPKIFNSRTPDRDEIITFYNPDVEKRGVFYNILTRVLYMGTFSLINIDRNKDGSIRETLLVKRTSGVSGDRLTFRKGDAYIRPAGTLDFVKEEDFRSANDYETSPHRTINESVYKGYIASGVLEGMYSKGVYTSSLPKNLMNLYEKIDRSAFYTDYYEYQKNYYKGQLAADPTDIETLSNYSRMCLGLYVPEGYVLPLGDNRDNSSDGRYFGPVPINTITGHVSFRIWPLKSAGNPDKNSK